MFSNKKAIIFDLDGTILHLKVNWDDLRKKLSKRCLDNYGEKRTFKRVSEYLDIIVSKGDENELEKTFELIKRYELDKIEKIEVLEDPIFFINNYKLFGIKNKPIFAILSLNMRKTVQKALKFAKIYDKFDFIVGREDVRKWKPNPEGLLLIKDKFGLKNEEMVYFGDLQSDILTGRNAKIDAYPINELVSLASNLRKIE
ncbi:MAG: HAD family hydrolase [Candidatus Lokiarchaeota archaeon]|nr:HAD family hydrolase [Candidatus Lokiarchaeota archaeon]